MRILFVAFSESIHSARWISQVVDQGWDIHLVPSTLTTLHPYLRGKVTFHGISHPLLIWARHLLINLFKYWPYMRGSGFARRFYDRLTSPPSPQRVARIIRKTKPDIVHSLEIQHAGYLTLDARKLSGANFPPWIASSWGSDLSLFGRIAEHKQRIQEVLASCDGFTSECEREIQLAQKYGFMGRTMPVLPVAGGFELANYYQYRQPGPTSSRRTILIKGYQNWAGRALVALRAVELCADVLQGYRVVIQMASPDVMLAAKLVAGATGIAIECLEYGEYWQGIRRFGAARIHLGLSISDGASTSFLESMVMGAFPIQSCTACANEWIEDGKSGLIVPPEDAHIVAAALRRAVTDDALVDQAVAINDETVRQRLNYEQIQKLTIGIYNSVIEGSSPALTA